MKQKATYTPEPHNNIFSIVEALRKHLGAYVQSHLSSVYQHPTLYTCCKNISAVRRKGGVQFYGTVVRQILKRAFVLHGASPHHTVLLSPRLRSSIATPQSKSPGFHTFIQDVHQASVSSRLSDRCCASRDWRRLFLHIGSYDVDRMDRLGWSR